MPPVVLALLMLAAAGSRNLTVEDLGNDRYRLTVVYGGGSPEVHARMQLRLMRGAERLCRGRGRPTLIGGLELNEARAAGWR